MILRVGVGLFLAVMVYFALGMLLAGVTDDATPFGMLVSLLAASGMLFGGLWAARWLHGVGVLELIGNLTSTVQQFRSVFAALATLSLAIFAATVLINIALPARDGAPSVVVTAGLPVMTWLGILPLTLGALLVQTGSEEFLFRGYAQSRLRAHFSDPRIWMILPSLIFGLLHFSPDMPSGAALAYVIWATGFGILTADLTARSGTLGPAVAVHFVNNFFAVAWTAVEGYGSGLALFMVELDLSVASRIWAALPAELMMLVLYWLAGRIALRA